MCYTANVVIPSPEIPYLKPIEFDSFKINICLRAKLPGIASYRNWQIIMYSVSFSFATSKPTFRYILTA